MFKAQCVTVRDPFHPMRNREIRTLEAAGPISALAPDTKQPFIILCNGQAVLRKDWDQPVSDGDLLAVVLLPQGGGDGVSDVGRVMMMIVVAIAAYYTGGAVGTAYGAGWGAAAQAAVGMVGAVLVNAMMPPPSASMGSGGGYGDTKSASPTYNLSAQGNTARLGGAIPIQYGRLNVYPDFAASPYVEYEGNEQYLYQLLCIGAGEYEIEQIRIEDSDISAFEEITYHVVNPGGTLTLFPAAVNTSGEVSGQEMLAGSTIGPFVANSAGTMATSLAVDVVCPRGLYCAEDDGSLSAKSISFNVQARSVDDNGTQTGSFVTIGSQTLSAATTTPQRYTFRYPVAAGRYEVQVTRTDAKDTSTRAGHEIVWAGLRSHIQSSSTFGDVTLLAMKMRATNNLSAQASRKVNVTCTRKLYQWTGAAWAGPYATRSPAWAIADACHTVGLTDSRIDLDALLYLDSIWQARGDTFDGRFDSTSTFWGALTKIAQAGRAKPYMQGGIVHIVRDQSVSLPVALYSMRNIKRNSFSLNFITPTDDTADAVQVTYFDSSTWKERTLTCKLPDSTASKPAKVELFGVVNREQAYREGVYMAAANRYRRTMIKFETEMEGFIPSYGDLVAINHDLPQWGQHAEVVAWDSATKTLTLSEPMNWGEGTHYVGLRRRDGSVSGPYPVEAVDYSSGSNMLPNAGFDIDTYGWGMGWQQEPTDSIAVMIRNLAAPVWKPLSANTIGIHRSGSPVGVQDFGTGCPAYNGQIVGATVTPGKRYCLSARLSAHRCSVQILLVFLDDTYTQLGNAQSDWAGHGVGGSLGGESLSAWDHRFAFGVAPAGATRAWFIVRQSAAMPGESNLYCWIAEPMLEEATADQVLPSAFTSEIRSDSMRLSSTPDFTPYTGQKEERTNIVFGWGDTWRQLARVISCKPKDEYTVELTCVNEDGSVHSADQGILAPPVNSSQLPATPSAPEIVGLDARSLPGDPTAMLITWQPAPGAEYYIVEQSADGLAWTRTIETRANNVTAQALYGSQTIIRVSAVGSVRGTWVTFNYALAADYMWNSNDSTLMWSADSNPMWRY